MQDDIRAEAAQYYDANPTIPDDLAFYTARLPSADAAVLELGCGTGRVLLPLAAACGSISGLERSPAMLARCLQKLQAAGIPPTKACAERWKAEGSHRCLSTAASATCILPRGTWSRPFGCMTKVWPSVVL